MTKSIIGTPLFELRADFWISDSPEEIYSVVSDVGRSGEWSPEFLSVERVYGEPVTVGARLPAR